MITRDGPLWMVVLAVTSGAAMGAMIRWTLTYLFNEKSWFFTAPMGTLIANLCAAFLMGMALAWLMSRPEIGPNFRLFVITGFLGAFSTLTAVLGENLHFMLMGQWLSAFIHFVLHIGGSFIALVCGVLTIRGHL